MRSSIFDKLSFISLFLTVALLPFFFLPFANIPVESSKGLLLVVGLALFAIFWTIARFLDGQIIFPKSALLLSALGIVVTFLISALVSGISSGNSEVSLFGAKFDVGSFWFVFAGFILMFFSSIAFRTAKRSRIVLLGVMASSVILLIFQSFHLFFPESLSLRVLDDVNKTSNIFGSWNALGLFAGFSGLMFLLIIEFFPISKIEKMVLSICSLLSILIVAAVNLPLIWLLLGVSSLIIFVYKISTSFQSKENGGKNERKNFPIISFIVVIISLLFFISSGFDNFIPQELDIPSAELIPTLSSTMSITRGVLADHPLFGIGPNRFAEAWAMYKPIAINNTQFWNVSFNSGSGLLPTLGATVGVLGLLALIVFSIMFLVVGVKSLFSSIKNRENWEMMAFFVLSLYLFVSSFFYPTGMVIFFLSLAFAGVFIGLTTSNSGKEFSFSFLNDHRKSFFSILILIIIIIFSLAVSFKYIERFISVAYFGRVLGAPTIPIAEEYIIKTLKKYENDLYLRTYAQVHLLKLNSLVQKGENLSDTEKADLQVTLDKTVNAAQLATLYNPSNYLNFQLLGSVYQDLSLFGVKDVYSKAFEAYKNASDLNPANPGLKLVLSSLSSALLKTEDAKNYAESALNLKQDYIDALLTLSQIAKSEGKSAEAISYAEIALSHTQAQLSNNPENENLIEQNQNLIKYIDSLKKPPASAGAAASKKP